MCGDCVTPLYILFAIRLITYFKLTIIKFGIEIRGVNKNFSAMEKYIQQLLADIIHAAENVSLPFVEKELQLHDWISGQAPRKPNNSIVAD